MLDKPCSTGRRSFWICFGLFALIYLALRVFWLDGDPGVPSMWEYGYNATDEGYYLGGGKEKFVWGRFVDLARTEVFTYGFSSGTHFLSYLAHLLFGLSTWTWRIPFSCVYFAAWLAAFVYSARRIGSVNALVACLAVSSAPMIVAYERTASNDVLIGALVLLAYVIAAGRGVWRIFAAAAVGGAIVLVKPSVFVLLPIVAAGVLETPKTRKAWMDLALFVGAAVLSVFAWKLVTAFAVSPEAREAGVSVWDVVKRTTTHYALPKLTDIASHLKGCSAFPRDPSQKMLGVLAVWISVFPGLMALRGVMKRKWNGDTLLFAAVPLYVVAVNVMNTQYTHYFIPAIMCLPIVLTAAVRALSEEACACVWKKVASTLAAAVAVCAVGWLFLTSVSAVPQALQDVYSRIYNFPKNNVWSFTGGFMALYVVGVVAFLAFLRGGRAAVREGAFWAVAAFAGASVSFAFLPAAMFAPYLHAQAGAYFAPMAVCFATAALTAVAVFGLAASIDWRKALVPFFAASVVICAVLTPAWRKAVVELAAAPTYLHAERAAELAKLLPEDAIVIGERSNQMLMSLPIRTATTFAANSDAVVTVRAIAKAYPDAPLYALADSQHAYNLQSYRKHQDEFRLEPVKTFKMPSFGDGTPADVYLCRIVKRADGTQREVRSAK